MKGKIDLLKFLALTPGPEDKKRSRTQIGVAIYRPSFRFSFRR